MKDLPRDSDGKLSAYAWPGGYPLFYVDGESNTLCVDCARRLDASDADPTDKPQEHAVNWEDHMLYCDDCGQRIESAYAEDEPAATT